METLTKQEISEKISYCLDLSNKQSYPLVNDILNLIADEVVNNKKIVLRNFGVFKVKHKSKRIGRNPAINNSPTYLISERNVLSFKAAPKLKAAVEDGQNV